MGNALSPSGDDTRLIRFGAYTLDGETLELFREGVRIDLQPQPARLLRLLALRAGRLVTREEILGELWPDTVIEFDQSLNRCIRQIRSALGESAKEPTFVETLPRRGYRFAALVEVAPRRDESAAGVAAAADGSVRRRRALSILGAAAALALVISGSWLAGYGRSSAPPEHVRFALLQGEYFLSQPGGAPKAIGPLEQVVEGAPDFARGWTQLATARFRAGDPERADLEAVRALSLDPEQGDAYLVRAQAALGRLDLSAAGDFYARALEIARDNPHAHSSYSFFALSLGKTDEALAHAKRAYELDPLSALLLNDIGVLHLWAGETADAIRLCGEAARLEPDLPFPRSCLLRAHERSGDLGAAIESAAAIMSLADADSALARMEGQPPREALRFYRLWQIEQLTAQSSTLPMRLYGVAALQSELCDIEAAMSTLRAMARESAMHVPSLRVNPSFSCAWTEDDFRAHLSEMGMLEPLTIPPPGPAEADRGAG